MRARSRLGLAGHRARTGEQLGRVVVVIDGVLELFGRRRHGGRGQPPGPAPPGEDGPAVGVHLVLADRTDPADPGAAAAVLAAVPAGVTTVVRLGDERRRAGPARRRGR